MDMLLIPHLGVLCASKVMSKVRLDHVLAESVTGSARDAPLDVVSVPAKSTSCQTLLSKTIVKSKPHQHFRIMLGLGRMVKWVVLALHCGRNVASCRGVLQEVHRSWVLVALPVVDQTLASSGKDSLQLGSSAMMMLAYSHRLMSQIGRAHV